MGRCADGGGGRIVIEGAGVSHQESCFFCSGAHKGYMREVAELDESIVYLGNEQEYVGRCSVVLKRHKTELFQLDEEERNRYMRDVARVAQALHAAFAPDKINYAVYGDIDSHIHFHVVPKHKGGKMWGWAFELTAGQGLEKFLSEREYAETIESIRRHLL